MAKPKNCVFIATVPDDWKPVFYHDVPPAILGGEFYVRSVSLARAKAFERARLASRSIQQLS